MKLASFFAGIGGIDLGFERAGADVVFHCEIDQHCQMILQKHWPDIPLHGDIMTLTPADIPDADCWSAGWPCQDISRGNVQGIGIHGEKSRLFFRFMELVREKKPGWLFLENVAGLLSRNGGEDFESVVNEIEESGYLGAWTTANAIDFGLPQDRERIIIVATLGTNYAHKVIAHGCQLQGDNPSRRTQRATSSAKNARGIGGDNAFVFQRRGGFGYTKGSVICPTLRSQSGKHQGGHSDRPILCGTKLDVDRMGAADGIPGRMDSRRGRLIGNAVAVPVAQWFAETMIAVEQGVIGGELDDVKASEQAQVERSRAAVGNQ